MLFAEKATAPITLRPYQGEAVERIDAALSRDRATLLVLPTGCGKTIVFCELIRRYLARGQRALVLAHRDELLAQARAKLARFGVTHVGVEKAARHADGEPVVVASVQTLRGERLRAYAPDAFGIIVIDEAQHAPSAGYQAIARHFANARLLGVTATPDRLDGQALGAVFDSVAYEYPLRDAIRDGWLVPIRSRRVHVAGLDLARVRTTAGDLNAGDLSAQLTREKQLHEVAAPLVELAGNRQTVVFTADVAHARALAAVIDRYRPGSARWVAGCTSAMERRAALVGFTRGDFQFLANCALLTEGWDEPSVSCVAIARPTESRALYTQMVGRGTRLHPGKRDLLVLDFVGNAGRHALVSTADVLAGARIDDELGAAVELLGLAFPDLGVLRVLELAEALVAAHRQAEAKRRARRELIEQRALALAEARVTAVATYVAEEIDPFLPLETGEDTPPPLDAPWAAKPANDKQRAYLRRKGVNAPIAMTAGDAARLIRRLVERDERGLCTFSQARWLTRRGVAGAHRLSKGEASRLIQQRIGQRVHGTRRAHR